VGVVGSQARRFVEADGPVALLGEEAVEDDEVKVEVGVEGGAEAVQALGGAGATAHAGEAVGQDAAAQVGADVVLDQAGARLAAGIGFSSLGERVRERVEAQDP
jgi:hypothetical protein